MMTFDINLIRSVVPSVARRRAIYAGLLLYLGMGGLVLVLLANLSARHLVNAELCRRETGQLLSHFRNEHGDRESCEDYAAALLDHLHHGASSLESAGIVLGQRLLIARILLGLDYPLPPSACIMDLQMNLTESSLNFTVVVLSPASELRIRPGDLVEQWNGDALLMTQVTDLKAVMTERVTLGGGDVLVHRFSCTIRTGAKENGSGKV